MLRLKNISINTPYFEINSNNGYNFEQHSMRPIESFADNLRVSARLPYLTMKTIVRNYLEFRYGYLFNKYNLIVTNNESEVYSFLYNFLKNNFFILPTIGYQKYDFFCPKFKNRTIKYDITDIKTIKKSLRKVPKDKNLTLIINDPCQLYTGYSMSEDDYMCLIKILKDCKHQKCNIIFDLAYIEFSSLKTDVFKFIDEISKIKDFKVFITFDFKHTFLNEKDECAALFYYNNCDASTFFLMHYRDRLMRKVNSRPFFMLKLLTRSTEIQKSFINDRERLLYTIETRSKAIKERLNQIKLETYKYEDGIFLSITNIKNLNLVIEKLSKIHYQCVVLSSDTIAVPLLKHFPAEINDLLGEVAKYAVFN